jgi:hypothetical protein
MFVQETSKPAAARPRQLAPSSFMVAARCAPLPLRRMCKDDTEVVAPKPDVDKKLASLVV